MASKKKNQQAEAPSSDVTERSNEFVSMIDMLGGDGKKADSAKSEESKTNQDADNIIKGLEEELNAIAGGVVSEATAKETKDTVIKSVSEAINSEPDTASKVNIEIPEPTKREEKPEESAKAKEQPLINLEPVLEEKKEVPKKSVESAPEMKAEVKTEAKPEKIAEAKVEAEILEEELIPSVEEKQEAKEKQEKEKKDLDPSSPLYYVRIVGVLTAICVGIALLLAVVNNMTKDVISENSEKEKQEAILAVFPEGDSVKEYPAENGETVFIVLKDGSITGYCVDAVGSGYNGDVGVMVGMTANGEVGGLKIVSISETPGVGSKVQNDTYLSQYIGLDHEATVGEEIDGISGATFSSKAITEAVNYAISLEVDLSKAAEELGAQIAESETFVEKSNDDNGDEELNPTVIGGSDEESTEAEDEQESQTETDVEDEELEAEIAAREEAERLAEEQEEILAEAQRKSEEAAAQAEAEAEAQRKAEEEAAAKAAEEEAQRKAEEEAAAQAEAEAEAQRKAEEEAAAKAAEEEAQRKAEEEAAAKAAAEAEAQRKAEEEAAAKAAAEAEAQRQAEEAAAKAAAEAEAQRQAEEAARQAAEAEAQRQAEEAARQAAEEAAQQSQWTEPEQTWEGETSEETSETQTDEPSGETTEDTSEPEETEEEPHEIQHGESTQSSGIISFKKS